MLPGSGDGFVTEVNTDGSDLVYSTLLDIPNDSGGGGGGLGGPGLGGGQKVGTVGYGIALDSSNNAYVTGRWDGIAGWNAIVAKLNSTGSTLLDSKTWGAGTMNDVG